MIALALAFLVAFVALFALALCRAARELQGYDESRNRARVLPMRGMWRDR